MVWNKGKTLEEFKKKLNRFKLEYPNIYILVIDEDIYNKIILKFKDKIDYEPSCKLKKNFKFKEVKIKKITKTNYSPKKVYNLTIEDDNSFIVNGLVVHNTQPHPFIRETLRQKGKELMKQATMNLYQIGKLIKE